MTVPNTFMNQEQYDEWLENVAESEMEKYLSVYHDDALHVDQIHEWVHESPVLDTDDWQWVKLYLSVRQFCHAPIPGERISVPEENPFPKIANATRMAVADDLGCRIHEMLEDEGYEVKA